MAREEIIAELSEKYLVSMKLKPSKNTLSQRAARGSILTGSF